MASPNLSSQSDRSVQELAKKFKHDVPHRYIQEHREPTFVSNNDTSLPSIPVIDMNDFINILGSEKDQLKNLRSVCQEWGIFQVNYTKYLCS